MNKLVIPSAGNSTRFYELGKRYPKILLPYKNKPILTHVIKNVEEDFDKVVLVIRNNNDLYKDVIEFYNLQNVEIREVNTSIKQGPGTSAFCGIDGNEESVTIMLSDAIYDFKISEMPGDSLSVMEVEDYKRWCMVDESIKFYDKPSEKPNTNLAVSGIYKISNPSLYYEISSQIIYSNNTYKEIEFSNILEKYNNINKLKLYKHSLSKFLDFGTIEKYIKNKDIPLSRNFNNIVFYSNKVKKISTLNREKVIKEGLWLKYFPIMREYIPNILNINILEASIEIERIYGFTIRDLLLYYDNSNNLWNKIFNSLNFFIDNCSKHKIDTTSFWENILAKTFMRDNYKNNEFNEYFKHLLKKSPVYSESTLFHGDLVFSNIIYSSNSEDLKFFDPRGELYGHWVYDLVKIGQSVLGNYDLIDSEMYVSEKNFYKIFSLDREKIQKIFFEIFEDKINLLTKKLFYCLIASLYLSLIPLHSHNKKNQKLYMEEFDYFYKLSQKN